MSTIVKATLAVIGLGMLLFVLQVHAAVEEAPRIVEIKQGANESLWTFLGRYPASFEAQIFYGLALSFTVGFMASWAWKWSQGQAECLLAHLTGKYVIGQFLWMLSSAGGLIATTGFTTSAGEFVGWSFVLVTGGLAGFGGDTKTKEKREAWTDEQRAAAQPTTEGAKP